MDSDQSSSLHSDPWFSATSAPLRFKFSRLRHFNRDFLLASTIPATSASTKAPALESHDDIALADRLKAGHDQIIAWLHKLIIGQDEVIEQVLLSLFTGGNSLIVGVPG